MATLLPGRIARKAIAFAFVGASVFAALNVIAVQMNYQGVVRQSGAAYQGTGWFKFALGDVSNTVNYWANDSSSSGEPGTGVPVSVTNGFFHLALGDGMADIPAALFTDSTGVYLRVWFGEQSSGPYEALGSPQRLLPVPYAVNAEMIEGYTFQTLTNHIDVNDADHNPSNELNSAVVLNGATLQVTDAGGTLSADLSSLRDDGDWLTSGDDLYNGNAGNVGIGVSNAAETLEVAGTMAVRNSGNTSAIHVMPSPTGTNLAITGSDNDGADSHPVHITDEDGYAILDVRSSLSPGAQFGANAARASVNGTVEANTFIGGREQSIDEGADFCFIGGGLTNRIEHSFSDYSGIAAGKCNTIGINNSSPYAFIGAGRSNIVDNDYGVICGGRYNYISRLYSFIGNGRENIIKDDRSVICGGSYNLINEYGEYCFIGGGYRNLIRSYNPSDQYNTIGSGFINSISNSYEAFIGGGSWNNISYGPFSTIAGGQRNISFEKGTTISGGRANRIVGEYCTVGGGWSNKVDGYSYYSTIPGGLENRIYAGNYGFAAGRYARIWHNGCFAWADSNPSTVDTTTHNQFITRASGGYVLYTAANGTTTGARLPGGSGSWSSLSDRHAKENIAEMNGRDVLDKLCAIPISTWNYKAQDDAIRHAGPMAQDFHAAFGLGEDERHLSSVDVDGIALAAIKELKRQKDAEIDELRQMVKTLTQRINELEHGE